MSAVILEPRCSFVGATCKVCGIKLAVQFSDNAEERWREQLLPMATCDACYDMIDAFKKAEDTIRLLCGKVRNRKLISKDGNLDDDEYKAFYEALYESASAFSLAVMQLHRASVKFWSDDFPRMLMQDPEKWYVMLRTFRVESALAYKTPSPYFEFMRKQRESHKETHKPHPEHRTPHAD